MIENEGRAPQGDPATRPVTVDTPETSSAVRQLKRRREASFRLVPLDCGCRRRDPWRPCRCTEGQPSDKQIEAVVDAAAHLRALGLAPIFGKDILRALWRAGHRDLAADLAQLGGVA